jgi:hypothetical protein
MSTIATHKKEFFKYIENSWRDIDSKNKAKQMLIDKIIDVNVADKNGQTALMYAVIEINVDLVEYLLKNGAYIDLKDDAGDTAIDIANQHDEYGTPGINGYRHNFTEANEGVVEIKKMLEDAYLKKRLQERLQYVAYIRLMSVKNKNLSNEEKSVYRLFEGAPENVIKHIVKKIGGKQTKTRKKSHTIYRKTSSRKL